MTRRTRLLARTCFGRFFENEVFSSSVSASSGLTWLLAALATPGVVISVNQLFFFARVRTFEPERQDRLFFLSQAFHLDFALAVAGLMTMLVWTSLTPDRRDALVLGPLPVGAGEQARARLLALTAYFLLFAVAVSVPSAVVFSFVSLGAAGVGTLVAHMTGHVVSTMLGAAFVFFALIDVQVLTAAALGPRVVQRLTWPLQSAALASMVVAIAFTGRLADHMLAPGAAGHAVVLWNPAAWFMGLYRWIAGDARPIFSDLGVRGLVALSAAVLVALTVYPLAYERCLRNVVLGDGRQMTTWSGAAVRWWLRALGLVLRTPLERGLASFMAATVSRSYTHRFVIGGYVGVAVLCALPLANRLLGPADTAAARYAWLSVPLGLLCWTSAALRVAMMLPVEPASNWLFKLTEPVDKRRVLSTAVTIIQAATAVPLALTFGAGAWLAGGFLLGATVLAVVLFSGLALAELLTLTLRTVPFTCTYRPGQLRLRILWPVYLIVWLLIAFRLPTITVRRLDDPWEVAWVVGSLSALWIGLRLWRLSRARHVRSFVYEEVDPSVTTTIDLSSARA